MLYLFNRDPLYTRLLFPFRTRCFSVTHAIGAFTWNAATRRFQECQKVRCLHCLASPVASRLSFQSPFLRRWPREAVTQQTARQRWLIRSFACISNDFGIPGEICYLWITVLTLQLGLYPWRADFSRTFDRRFIQSRMTSLGTLTQSLFFQDSESIQCFSDSDSGSDALSCAEFIDHHCRWVGFPPMLSLSKGNVGKTKKKPRYYMFFGLINPPKKPSLCDWPPSRNLDLPSLQAKGEREETAAQES